MKTKSFLKYSFYICFIFALICTIPQSRGLTGVFAFAAALWTLVCIFSSRMKSPIARVLISVLSCAVVAVVFWSRILARPLGAILLGATAVLFTIFMGLGRFETEYWKFRRTFISMVSVSFFVSFLNIIIYIAVDKTTKRAMNLEEIVLFTFACALLGVFVLSELRKGDADTKWKAMNAGRIVAIMSMAAASLVLLFLVLSFGFSLIKPIMGPLAKKLKNDYVSYDGHTIPYSMTVLNPDGEISEKDYYEDEEEFYAQKNKENEGLPWWIIAICAAVLLALIAVLVILHIRRKRAQTLLVSKENASDEQDLPDEVQQIRAIYKQYIAFVQKNAGELSKGSTSEDILENSVTSDDVGGLEKELREIYIKARYGKSEDVTADDAARATELYQAIVAKAEEPKEKS